MRSPACALAIGGLDPGGGAGIVADLRAFAAAGAYGCAAVAVVTVQSTAGLVRARPLPSHEVVAQAAEVMAHQRVRSLKVGALGSAANVLAVAGLLAEHPTLPAVVDTPMRATRQGVAIARRETARAAREDPSAALLATRAVGVLRESLLPRATLVTVNAVEAGALLGDTVRSLRDARDAAAELARAAGCAVIVKGGHIAGRESVDVLAIEGAVVELRAPRLAIRPVHGTGCTFASLIAGRLALVRARNARRIERAALEGAVRWAKRVHYRALARAVSVGGAARVLVFP